MKRTSRMCVARKSWRVWGAAILLLLTIGGEARAFYWVGWPGSLVRVEETLLPPPVVPDPLPPTVVPPDPPIRTPTPPVGPPVPIDKPPVGPPTQTPEPATGLLGLIGLGALAARKWRKKK